MLKKETICTAIHRYVPVSHVLNLISLQLSCFCAVGFSNTTVHGDSLLRLFRQQLVDGCHMYHPVLETLSREAAYASYPPVHRLCQMLRVLLEILSASFTTNAQ